MPEVFRVANARNETRGYYWVDQYDDWEEHSGAIEVEQWGVATNSTSSAPVVQHVVTAQRHLCGLDATAWDGAAMTLVAGGRMLVVGATNAAHNGLYLAHAGEWVRDTSGLCAVSDERTGACWVQVRGGDWVRYEPARCGW